MLIGNDGATFNPAGATGGTGSIIIPDHSNHTHTFTASANAPAPHLVAQDTVGGVASGGTTDGASATLDHINPSTSSNVFPVLPPYVVVYFWQRTA